MNHARLLALLLLASAVVGCALFRGGRETVVYPVSAARADKILSDSLAEEFGVQSVHRLSHPNVGYRVEVGAEAILAVRMPAVGRGEDGDVNGFLLEIKLRGSPAQERVDALARRIAENGSRAATPLPLVRRLD